MNHIQLSDHFNYPKLLRFVAPSVIMMIFTSIYGVVDGFFVSNYVGKTPFAALNLIYPFLMLLGALGFMMGTGGTAIVARKLGEDRKKEANAAFSMLVEATVIGGVILTAGGFLVLRPIARWMGAEGAMLEDCVLYGGILLLSLTAFMLQNLFQSFFVTAEEPKLGLWVMIAAGVTNMVLDALFIAVFQWGLAGAAAASALSPGVVPQREKAGAPPGKGQTGSGSPGGRLHQRIFGADDQHLHVPGEHPLQLPAYEPGRRGRGGGLRGHYVCELCLYRHLHWVFPGERPHHQLPLRGPEPPGNEESVPEKRRPGDHYGGGHDPDLGAAGPAPDRPVCGV